MTKFVDGFSADNDDYDLYGVKIAANDVLFAQARSKEKNFLVHYAPYNYTSDLLQCEVPYQDKAHYIYSVDVGSKQSSYISSYFYFIGTVSLDNGGTTDSQGRNGSFIGIVINKNAETVLDYLLTHRSLPCNYVTVDRMQFFSSYGEQEYFVHTVEPYGQYALGFATNFIFKYQPFANVSINTQSSATFWPNNATFYPCAADTNGNFTIVAGFVANAGRSRIRATPTVYVVNNRNMSVVATWSYAATNGTWQTRLSYSGISTWSKKYTMSVKINDYNSRGVLIGMPFLNTVFLFAVENDGTTIRLLGSKTDGQAVGYSKSVTWISENQAAILASIYSSDYTTWSYSQLQIFIMADNNQLPESPAFGLPNIQQPLPSTINGEWIRMISTPTTVAILDVRGGAMIILPESTGLYPSTDTTKSLGDASMPVISHSSTCIAGTYKSSIGIQPCLPCQIGTRNPGTNPCTVCLNCSSNTFCPIGSAYEVNWSAIESISQTMAYPSSPDIDNYEDILLTNMFLLYADAHCIRVSPLFWILVLAAIIIIALITIESTRFCMKPEKQKAFKHKMISFFEHTDLIGEGELWFGGLVSIIVILVSGMAYGFAISYLYQYPAEDVGPSNFACDTTIRNAKYESNLKSLAIPASDTEQTIFDMLDQQNFTFNIEFINTASDCTAVSISQIVDSTTLSSQINCSTSNGIIRSSVQLFEHDLEIVVTLNDIQTVGAIRLGLSGPGKSESLYTLKDLYFLKAFYDSSNRTFAQRAKIGMYLTKVVNETESLSGDDSEYSGIWYPTFTYTANDIFVSDQYYASSANGTKTVVTIMMSEISYYIKNVQSPIAKKPEIIFRTLLFASLCLEICALSFLMFNLVLIPIARMIIRMCRMKRINTTNTIDHE